MVPMENHGAIHHVYKSTLINRGALQRVKITRQHEIRLKFSKSGNRILIFFSEKLPVSCVVWKGTVCFFR